MENKRLKEDDKQRNKKSKRKTIKKMLTSFVMLILCCFMVFAESAQAITISTISSTKALIPEGYHFAPHYFSGVTTYSLCSAPSGYKWNIGNSEITLHNSAGKEAIPPNSAKGKIYITYKKVGYYNNQWVDMRVTITGWRNPKRLCFGKTSLAVGNASGNSGGTSKSITVKIDFYKNGTTTLVSGLKGHHCVDDLDYFSGKSSSEWIKMGTNCTTKILLPSASASKFNTSKSSSNMLGKKSGGGSGASDGDQFVYLFSSNTHTFTWYGGYLKLTDSCPCREFQINYMPNGGSGSMSPTIVKYGVTTSTRKSTFTKTGYYQSGWRVYREYDNKWAIKASDGSGTWGAKPSNASNYYLYSNGGTLAKTAICGNIYFYANWQPNILSCKYNANGGKVSDNSNGTWELDDAGNIIKNGDTSMILHKLYYDTNSANGLVNATTMNLIRPGYTFVGWTKEPVSTYSEDIEYYDQDMSGVGQDFESTLADGNQTLTWYALWKPNDYAINYDLSGGTMLEDNPTSYTIESEDISVTDTPSRPGYTFKNWNEKVKPYSFSNGFLNYDTGVLEVNNTTYPNSIYSDYIRLEAGKQYTLHDDVTNHRFRIYGLDGTFIESTDGSDVYTPTSDCYMSILYHEGATEEQYNSAYLTVENVIELSGFNSDIDANNNAIEYSNNVILEKGKTYTTHNIQSEYSLNIYDSSGSLKETISDSPESYTADEDGYLSILFKNGTAENETSNIYLTSNSYDDIYIPSGSAGHKTYVANWIAHKYTFKYEYEDQTMPDTVFTYDEAQNLPKNTFTKTGYQFDYWNVMKIEYYDEEGNLHFETWERGSNPSEKSLLGTFSDQEEVLNFIDKNNAVVTLSPRWKANTYTFKYKYEDQTMPDTVFTYDVAKKLPENTFTETGYKFAEWNITYKDSKKSGQLADSWQGPTTGSKKLQLTAKSTIGTLQNKELIKNYFENDGAVLKLSPRWEAIKYTIQFDGNGNTGGSMDSVNYEYDGTYKLPANGFTKTGYRFTGWSCTNEDSGETTTYSNESYVSNLSTEDGAVLTFKANWTPINYKIEYNGNGSDDGDMSSETVLCQYDKSYTVADNCYSRVGYTFKEWNTEANGSGISYSPGDAASNITTEDGGTVTLYAQWEPITYTIQFEGNGNDAGTMDSITCKYDEIYILPKNTFTKTGYNFSGWERDLGNRTESYIDGQEVKNLAIIDGTTVTLTAHWSIGSYTATFDVNGGEPISPNTRTLQYNSDIGTLPVTTREGYKLKGWFTEPEGGTEINSGTKMPGKDTTFYAQWRQNTYYIEYNGNGSDGGTAPAKENCLYDENYSIRDNTFTKTDSKFIGWNTQPNGSGTSYAPGDTFTNLTSVDGQTITLYAQWKKLVAFAVYSEDDNSLNFYKRYDVPSVGDTFEGTTVTAVYTGIEKLAGGAATQIPWYEYHESITNVKAVDVIKPINISYWFNGLSNCYILDLNNLDVSQTKKMISTFYSTGKNISDKFEIIGLDSWNVANVTNMATMFDRAGYNAKNWNIGDLSHWNVGNVINIGGLFAHAGHGADNWNIGNLDNWNVSNVTDMSSMFDRAGYNAKNWNIGDLSHWNVGNVKYMESMFRAAGYYADNWNIGDLDNWNVGNVTNMSYMFYSAGTNTKTWTLGDLSHWNVGNVTNMSYMFYRAGYSATTFDLGNLANWNTSNVTNTSYMFYKAGYNSTLYELNLANWDVSKVTKNNDMFSNCRKLYKITFGDDFSFLGNGSIPVINNQYLPVPNPSDITGASGYWYNIDTLDKYNPEDVPNNKAATYIAYVPYTVSYSTNNGIGSMDSQSMYMDYTYTLNKNTFTRAGYEFTGWNTRADGNGTSYNDEATVSNLAKSFNENVILYAQWNQLPGATYTIIYQSESGRTLGTDSATHDIGTIHVIDAKDFIGYTTPESQTITWDSNEKTITFIYVPIEYNITIDNNGGSGVNSSTYNIESSDITIGTPTRNGYTFAGWTGSNGSTPSKVVTIPSGSIGDKSYKANWNIITYNITYQLNGGVQAPGQRTTYTIETETFNLLSPTREGWTFDGWYKESSFTTKVSYISKGTTGDMTLYAKWSNEKPIISGPVIDNPDDNEIAPFVSDGKLIIQVGDIFTPSKYVNATDKEDGNLNDEITYTNNVPLTDGKAMISGTYTVIYNVTDKGGASGTYTLIVLVNEAPYIEARNRTFFQYQYHVDVEELIKKVIANDKEDGDIHSNVKVDSINYLTRVDTSVVYLDTDVVGAYTIEYSITDKYKKTTTDTAVLYIVANDSLVESQKKSSFRFISIDYINTLKSTSRWASGTLNSELLASLNNAPEKEINFSSDDIKDIKEYLKNNNRKNAQGNAEFNEQYIK